MGKTLGWPWFQITTSCQAFSRALLAKVWGIWACDTKASLIRIEPCDFVSYSFPFWHLMNDFHAWYQMIFYDYDYVTCNMYLRPSIVFIWESDNQMNHMTSRAKFQYRYRIIAYCFDVSQVPEIQLYKRYLKRCNILILFLSPCSNDWTEFLVADASCHLGGPILNVEGWFATNVLGLWAPFFHIKYCLALTENAFNWL